MLIRDDSRGVTVAGHRHNRRRVSAVLSAAPRCLGLTQPASQIGGSGELEQRFSKSLDLLRRELPNRFFLRYRENAYTPTELFEYQFGLALNDPFLNTLLQAPLFAQLNEGVCQLHDGLPCSLWFNFHLHL